MLILRFVAWMFSVSLMFLDAGMVCGQDYPNKPVRSVTSAGVGSAVDFVCRLIAQGLSGLLGQKVIVDNRGDGIAQQIVAKAAPDGYTYLVTATGMWVEPLLRKTTYDPVKDFLPITLATKAANILVVHPSLPAKSVQELIALAKAKPGTLNFSSGGTGGSAHLAGELFKSMASVNIVHVAYKSAGVAVTAVLGSEVQMMFATAGAAAPHLKSNRLRALAITAAQPSVLHPGLPTIAASGVPGYEAISMVTVFAPPKTPVTFINRLNREIRQVLTSADGKEQLVNAGIEAVGSSPEELAATMKSDMARMGKVIEAAGIRAE